jgi:hypothetical protein
MTGIQLALYDKFLTRMAAGLVNWSGNTALTVTLHTSAYVPDRANHALVSQLSNELAAGSGYSTGGVTLTNPVVTTTVANSWSATWATGATYRVGQVVRPTVGNGLLYQVTTAGVSAAGEPTWPTTIGECVTDGSVHWSCAGRAMVQLDANNLAPGWTGFSAGPFRHVVLSDRLPVGAASQTLIGVWSYTGDQVGGSGDYDLVFDAAGLILFAVA